MLLCDPQVVSLEEEVKGLRDAGAGGWFQTMHLPEGMAVTSSDVIASINEHLVQTLQVRHPRVVTLGKDTRFTK